MINPLKTARKSLKNRWKVLIEVSTGYEVKSMTLKKNEIFEKKK